ncbi:MAG: hypothetical protein V4736_12380 [Bdellovibrionota bacterium]
MRLLLALTLLASLGCSKGQNFGIGATQNQYAASVLRNNKVDILWVVDESQSMTTRKSTLTAQIPALLDGFDQMRMDYHLAVTTMSLSGTNPTGGKFIGTPKYLTNSSANVRGEIADRILMDKVGSSAERAMDSVKKVLSPSYLAGEGAGFLRPDSILVIVVVSDEDDTTASVTDMKNFFNGIRPKSSNGEQNWFLNYIGSIPGGTPICYANEALGTVVFGYKYIDLADYSGGISANVCDTSLALAVSNIRSRIIQILTDYPLRQIPKIDTISVSVNGVKIPNNSTNGWTYVPATNVVRFHGSSIPAADARVEVNFTPASAS